jgi:hypothetical protein
VTADAVRGSGLFPWDELASECRENRALWTFVGAGAGDAADAARRAQWSKVLAESRPDRAFAEATALPSYAAYALLANASLQAADELSELTGKLSWRSLSRFFAGAPAIILALVTVAVAALGDGYVALACEGAAIVLAPVAGLLWRGALPRRARVGGMLARLTAVLLAAGGLAALIAPMWLGYASLYWPTILIAAFLMLASVFAVDHARSPRLRDVKSLLVLRKGYGLERQATAARARWLDEARDKAVSHELTQAVNRLLAPEHETSLFVRNATGLRAIHHEGSQVRTLASQRLDSALDRSDGASIAVAGPRGSGKTNLLTELCRSESRFSVLVSAPTQYAPREFLLQLFQELCAKYIRDQGGADEWARGRARAAMLFARDNAFPVLRLAAIAPLAGLLAWDLASRTAARDVDSFPRALLLDKTALYAVVLSALIMIAAPKRLRFGWRKAKLITKARGYLTELRAEQTITSQVQSTVAMLQASRSKASKSLPWTMPEVVSRLRDFLAEIAEAEAHGKRRRVLVCIDEVDRIGSADDATRFLSEVKAVFGAPHCYFVVAIADELGVQLGRRAITGRPLSDNAFDEIISVEPMTFDMCRDLLSRRVLGFTESFVWLSLVLSGGLPRDVIRVARRLAEMAIESGYRLRLSGCAQQLVREEVYEATVASRSRLTELLPDGAWGSALDELRSQIRAFASGGAPADPRPSLRQLVAAADAADKVPDRPSPEDRLLAVRLGALALLGLTICDAFSEEVFTVKDLRDPGKDTSEHYEDLAVARRELGVSAESCRQAVEQVRKGLKLNGEGSG